MTPEQAAAAIALGAKLVVPIRYGVTPTEDYAEFPNAEASFIEEARKRKLPVEIVASGEWMKWKASH